MKKISLAAAIAFCLLILPAITAQAEPQSPSLKEVSVASLWPQKASWLGQPATIYRTKLYATASYLLLFRQPDQDMAGDNQLFYSRTLIGKTYTIKALYELQNPGATPKYFWLLTRPGDDPLWVRDTINTPLDNLPFATPEDIAAEHKQLADLASLAGARVWLNRNIAAPPQLGAALDHLAPLTITAFKSAGPFSESYTLTLSQEEGAPVTWTVGITGNRAAYTNRQFYQLLSRGFHLKDPAAVYPQWSAEEWQLIRNREIRTGWDKSRVLMSWDAPDRSEKILLGPDKDLEKWTYSGKHLFFKDTKLVKIKVPKPANAQSPPISQPPPKPAGKNADKSKVVDDGLMEVPGAVKEEKKKEAA